MLPNNSASTSVDVRSFIVPSSTSLTSYHHGSMAIGDPSGGLLQQIWRCTYVNGQIVLYDSTDTQYPMIAVPGLTWCRFAFDQNMRPVFAYVANGASYYRWYDPIALDYVTVALPVGAVSPCVALDDARSLQIPVSDLIIAYIENDILYMLVQRERYGITHQIGSVAPNSTLHQIGMTTDYRFQFLIHTTS